MNKIGYGYHFVDTRASSASVRQGVGTLDVALRDPLATPSPQFFPPPRRRFEGVFINRNVVLTSKFLKY
jgi:hypothetical protein